MIEIPVDDTGQSNIPAEHIRLAAEALGLKAVAARRDQHVPRIGAVAAHAAVQTDLLERDPLAVIGHDHGKRGRAAFQRLHLHDDGYLDGPPLPRLGDLFLSHGVPQLNRSFSTCVLRRSTLAG